LSSLERQTGEFTLEVIVVNSSGDATPDLIAEKFPSVKLIQLPERALSGIARNIGAKEASGDFIAFLDSDCTIEEDWLQRMLAHYRDDFCAVGGPILNSNPDNAIGVAGYLLEFGKRLNLSARHPVKHLPSGNLLLSREIFKQVGGFPEDFEYLQGDRLFSWILKKKTGKELMYFQDVSVKHFHREDLREFLRHQQKIGRGGAEILKHTDLPGSRLMKRKWLISLLVPCAAVKKLVLSLTRAIQRCPLQIIRFPHVPVLMLMGMIYWTVGFYRGIANSK
jgi:GT2 family glycosyltransferase